MPLDDSALTLMANALDAAITHVRFHSADPGTAETSSLGAARLPIAFTSDADGDLTLDAAVNVTGLAANQAVTWVTLWSALTGGTRYGKFQLTGDLTANAAGEYSLTALTINSTAS